MSGRLFSLREVAEITGFSLRSIEIDCRAGRVPHERRGLGTSRVHRRMTAEQIEVLRRYRQIGPSDPRPEPLPADPLAAARAMTRARAARRSGHRH